MRIQLLEIKGKLEFDANKYHNQRYNDLLKKVVNYRVEFQKMKDTSARKELAKEEFDAWFNYLNGRKQDMPMPDYDINAKDLSLIKENFDRFKVNFCKCFDSFFYYRIEKLTELQVIK